MLFPLPTVNYLLRTEYKEDNSSCLGNFLLLNQSSSRRSYQNRSFSDLITAQPRHPLVLAV
jgi:hypothetical protein